MAESTAASCAPHERNGGVEPMAEPSIGPSMPQLLLLPEQWSLRARKRDPQGAA